MRRLKGFGRSMLMHIHVARWRLVALAMLMGLMACLDSTPGELATGGEAQQLPSAASTAGVTMPSELRAAAIAALQANAGESYRAERQPSGAARFIHLSQRFEATIDGTA